MNIAEVNIAEVNIAELNIAELNIAEVNIRFAVGPILLSWKVQLKHSGKNLLQLQRIACNSINANLR